MTDRIPDDIMKAAREAYESLSTCCISSSPVDFRAEDISIIARALMAERAAERERCAGKARLAMVGNPDADELTCSICAQAIRGGTNDAR
jgi:hypothetical protein